MVTKSLRAVLMALVAGAFAVPRWVQADSPPAARAATEETTGDERVATLEQQRDALREEIDALTAELARTTDETVRAGVEGRLAELRERLGSLEAELQGAPEAPPDPPPPAATGPRGPADPQGLAPLDVTGGSGQVTSGTAFNPAISVIPDGVYYSDDRNGEASDLASEADGFHSGGAGHTHGGAADRGFSLREAELTFSGAVDPYFDVWAIFAVADGEIEVEEGYVQTRKFLPGLQLKFGKFYSGIGYINKQHPHQWDFVDQALPYDAIFGGALNETGVQLTWLPNLPVYTQLGLEALQGTNGAIASQIGPTEETPYFSSMAGPRLYTAFLKVSPDVGYSNTLQVGASYGYARQHQELHDEGASGSSGLALQGHTWFLGADAVWKYDSPRQYGKGDLTVQAEYLYRVKDLVEVAEEGAAAAGGPLRYRQDGLYAQAVYGLFSRWTVGVRFDTIGLVNQIETPGGTAGLGASRRYTADLTFNPTEFSRLRAQYDHGDFEVGGARETFNQVYVQFQMSLGAHGAHRF
jgi:hypothetical protein